MIYINISDSSIEYIRTSKNIIGRENIINCGRKIIPENSIKSGLIADAKSLKTAFKELNLERGVDSKENLVSVVISDEAAYIRRFQIPAAADNQLQIKILDEAKNVLKANPATFENFYRIIKSSASNLQILYAAIPISTVVAYSEFLETLGLKLKYLTSASFALASLLTPVAESDRGLLYCQIGSHTLDYSLFDKNGPIAHLVADESSNLSGSGFKKYISKIEADQQISIGNIVLFGKNYPEIDLKALTEEVNLKIIRLDDIFSQVKKKGSIDIDSGGIPQVFFAQAIALFISVKSSMTPNFAVDIDKIEPVSYKELTGQEDTQDKPGTITEKSATKNKPEVDEEILVEYKKSKLTLMTPKSKLIFIPIIIVLIIIIGVFLFSSQGKNLAFPFLSQPTLTPTPTSIPTATPTPTIDPNLKRSDLKLSVQNGTQTTGLAKDTADALEKLGYKNIGKSNADRDDYEQTVLKIKDGKKNYLPIILADLKDKTGNPTVESLAENNNFDLIIIMGKK